MKQNQKGRRGRNRNQSRRSSNNGSRGGGRPPTRNRNQAKQQVEKFTSLAREALQSQDFVAAQNYYQHAEFFQRLLNELSDHQPDRKPAQVQQTARGGKHRKDTPQGQPSGKVISIEGGEASDEVPKGDDDEALTA